MTFRLSRAYAPAAGGLGLSSVGGANLILPRGYAATGSGTMSRVIDGSTLTPGPIVDEKTIEWM